MKTKAFGEGKNPCLLQDLVRIFESMPSALPTKKEEISLFLYAISCGARASTCADVRLQDIERVEWNKDLQRWAVTVSLI